MSANSLVNDDSNGARICGMLLHAYYIRDPRVQRAAQALRDDGWTVKVVCLNEGGEADEEVVDGIQVIRCRMSRSGKRTRFRFVIEYLEFMLRSALKLLREEIRERHDLILVHNMPNALVFSTLLLRLRGCPVVLDMHDAAPEVFVSHFGVKSKLFLKLVLLEEKLAIKFASALITVNHGIEAVLRKRHPHDEFLIVHNSPSAQHMMARDQSSVLGSDGFRMVFHGHLHERSGIQRVVRVIPALVRLGIDIRFDVHGDGPYREPLLEMLDRLEVSDRVTLHGRFTPEELSEILGGKHLGIAPHFKDDLGDLMLPVKILEYTQVGLPVLCSRLATVESYFSEDSMYFFDSDEDLQQAIVAIHHDYAVALECAARARRVSDTISWEVDSVKLVDFVSALCNTR